jgi:type II secretory pathway pseudopilin PulG
VNQYPQYAQNIPPVYQPAGGITTPPAGGKSSSTGKIVLIVLAVLVILGGLGAAIGISARNNQIATNNARATATANTKNATATAQTYATATAAASTYPFSATLKWGDPLSDNSHGHGWPMDNRCQFAADGYHAVNPQSNSYITCPAMKTSLSDFTYQVSMQITQGEVGGLTFRGDDNNSRYYSFIFDQSGAYVLFIYKNKGEKPTTLHEEGATSHFKANQKNELGVVARGSQITLYVNKQKLTTVHDSTFSSGQIGVIVYNFGETVEAVFTDAKVWQL